MSRQITRVATVMLVLFGALFVNLNIISLIQSDDLANHPANRRLIIREYQIDRGPLVVDGEAIAFSTETDGDLRYLREYAEPELYAHITGYYSFILQRSGLEAALNEDLTGQTTEMLAQNLGELLGARDRAGNAVELTVRAQVQRAARDALGGQEGAVVAIEPATGAVLASYSNPSFDPNPLSSHDPAEIRQAWEALQEDPARPTADRALRETFPPGSAFKLITGAAALERGIQPDTTFPDEVTYDVPQTTADIGNFGGGTCTGGGQITLADAMRVSCNTTFARLGVDMGDDELVDMAEAFGFNRQPPYELGTATSAVPKSMDVPSTAQSAIGQRDVRATPMQMALLAAALVNDGELIAPRIVEAVRDPSGRQIRGPDIDTWSGGGFSSQAVSPRTASQLRQMMVAAVNDGTGTGAQISGIEVGGKTGTAQTGGDPVAWFVGFAGDDVAVAVVVPNAGPNATGGSVAAPIARQVLEAAVAGD